MVEILLVLVLVSCGLLPVYSLLRTGQQRISRADTKTIATMFGASALELARSIGFDKAQKLGKDDDFAELCDTASKNGYEISEPIILLRKVTPTNTARANPLDLLRIEISVRAKRNTAKGNEIPDLKFVTILTDPRFNYY